MTRREWLARALLGAQALLLASCGGDDEDEERSDLAPPSRTGTGSDAVKESQETKLAVLDNRDTIRDAENVLKEWEKGGIPGLPQEAILTHVTTPIPAGDNYADQATLGVPLVFPEPVKETALESMARAQASYVASGWAMSQWLHTNVTLPLAREAATVEQAIRQATHWLQSYVNQ